MIVLDTNVVSEPLRPAPDASVVDWLDAQVIETLYLTSVSLAEVRCGVASLPPGRRRQALHDRVEGEVVPLFEGRVLPFDEPASAAYAEIRARTRAEGTPLGDFDALIAGVAASRGCTVATRDTSPFVAAHVPVIDPFAAHD